MRRILFLVMCAGLVACAGLRPAPEIALDEVIEAVPIPDPPAPVQVVEVPTPMPLPGQLKPLPTSKPLSARPVEPQHEVAAANRAARIEPMGEGFVNATQVWPYSAGALYQVYASPGRVTDIVLEAGEQLVSVSAGDTVRWIIGDTLSGGGAEERVHVLVKPTRSELQTNLVVSTDRRSYHLELSSTPQTWMASVSWEYPGDLVRSLRRSEQSAQVQTPVGEGIALERLQFRYSITGDTPAWRPLRAFDDGQKVYIQFPASIAQGELPPLFVIGAAGDTQLVNYRVRAPYYIVDRLFGAAELRLGGDKAQVVRITRTDGRTRERSRAGKR
ncbi:MAG: P-type conjugative transfer protein TrbG [Pseudoxanthomonas sp.]